MDPTAIEEAATAAVQTAFEELCRTPVVPGPPTGATADAVVATIALKRTPPGVLRLAFPHAVLEALAERYLPEESLSEEMIRDTAGEFANVIAGQLKTMMKGTSSHFDLSTPAVGSGAVGGGGITVAFACDAGEFLLQVELPEANPS